MARLTALSLEPLSRAAPIARCWIRLPLAALDPAKVEESCGSWRTTPAEAPLVAWWWVGGRRAGGAGVGRAAVFCAAHAGARGGPAPPGRG
ncbi:MAG: hypothetical protein ABDI20_07235, partial [Candidatus Bipolaricaulaceae bacterium]